MKSSEAKGSVDRLRRQILLGAIGTAVLLEMAGIGNLVSEVFAEDHVDEKERVTDEDRIKKIETGFSKFGRKILGKLDVFVRDFAMQAKIRRVFEIFEENKRNTGRHKAPLSEIPYGAQNGFYYDFFTDNRPYYIGFNGLYRKLKIDRSFNPDDLGWLVSFCHELMHVDHDNKYRGGNIPFERYRAYWVGEEAVAVVVEDEAEAIAVASEILNIATGGVLKNNILHGKAPNVPMKQPGLEGFLEKMAVQYYTKDYSSFVDAVREQYKKTPGEEAYFTRDLKPISRSGGL